MALLVLTKRMGGIVIEAGFVMVCRPGRVHEPRARGLIRELEGLGVDEALDDGDLGLCSSLHGHGGLSTFLDLEELYLTSSMHDRVWFFLESISAWMFASEECIVLLFDQVSVPKAGAKRRRPERQ